MASPPIRLPWLSVLRRFSNGGLADRVARGDPRGVRPAQARVHLQLERIGPGRQARIRRCVSVGEQQRARRKSASAG